jgi:hypothetical protein
MQQTVLMFNKGRNGKPYAPPVSGTEPRFARVGAMLGRPVNTAAAGFFSFLCGFYGFLFYCFTVFFWFFFFFYFFRFLLKILNIFKI